MATTTGGILPRRDGAAQACARGKTPRATYRRLEEGAVRNVRISVPQEGYDCPSIEQGG